MTGRIGEYHSGCSRYGMMRNSEPSDDWCRVESPIPTITNGIRALTTVARMPARRGNSSAGTGKNSKAKTVRYSMTHQPTSNSGDRGFQ